MTIPLLSLPSSVAVAAASSQALTTDNYLAAFHPDPVSGTLDAPIVDRSNLTISAGHLTTDNAARVFQDLLELVEDAGRIYDERQDQKLGELLNQKGGPRRSPPKILSRLLESTELVRIAARWLLNTFTLPCPIATTEGRWKLTEYLDNDNDARGRLDGPTFRKFDFRPEPCDLRQLTLTHEDHRFLEAAVYLQPFLGLYLTVGSQDRDVKVGQTVALDRNGLIPSTGYYFDFPRDGFSSLSLRLGMENEALIDVALETANRIYVSGQYPDSNGTGPLKASLWSRHRERWEEPLTYLDGRWRLPEKKKALLAGIHDFEIFSERSVEDSFEGQAVKRPLLRIAGRRIGLDHLSVEMSLPSASSLKPDLKELLWDAVLPASHSN